MVAIATGHVGKPTVVVEEVRVKVEVLFATDVVVVWVDVETSGTTFVYEVVTLVLVKVRVRVDV